MKKLLLAVLVIFVIGINPVLAQAIGCCEDSKEHNHTHKADENTKPTIHVDHHCCHGSAINYPIAENPSAVFEFTASKFAITHTVINSLDKASPLLKPPASV